MLATADYEQARLDWHYEPDTGALIKLRNVRRDSNPGGGLGWALDDHGYPAVWWGHVGGAVRVHRIAWLLQTGGWPQNEIDHANRVRHDNRWLNLRDVPHHVNTQNRSMREDTLSGHRGVYWHKGQRQWTVQVTRDGRLTYISAHDTLPDAIVAWHAADRDPQHGPCGCPE